jgi:hypothetical protein
MSLRDVITEIAKDMEKEAGEVRGPDSYEHKRALQDYAKQLRRALKASEGEVVAAVRPIDAVRATQLTPEMQHVLMIEEERNRIRASKGGQIVTVPGGQAERMGSVEERVDGINVEVEGGQLDGTFVPVPPEMPPGAKTELFKEVYVLTLSDGGPARLIYSEEETKKYGQR